MIRDTARQFANEEVTPVANRLDPEHGEIPRELIAHMGELGFFRDSGAEGVWRTGVGSV